MKSIKKYFRWIFKKYGEDIEIVGGALIGVAFIWSVVVISVVMLP